MGSQDFKKAEMTKMNKWITNMDLLYSTWNSAQCYVVAWMGEEFGENGEKRILVVLCNTREVSRSPWGKLH